MRFTHLHVHSHYSLLDGLAKIDELIAGAKELGMESLALTDHGAMYGVVEFYKKAITAGIKPIIGMEAYIAFEKMTYKRPNVDDKRYHLVLLVKNREGYQNLIKLNTKAHLEGFYYKPRIDRDLLRRYSKGLIGLSGCLRGEIPRKILSGNFEEAKRLALEYQEIFGKGNFYLEVQHHPNIKEQQTANRGMKKLASDLDIPLVASQDVHYIKPEDAEAQDILMAIQTGNKLMEEDRLTMKEDDFSLKPQEEMIEAFKDVPEAIENTQKIAAECNIRLELGKIQLPYFEVPQGYTPNSYLRQLCGEGILKRFPKTSSQQLSEVKKKLDYELSVIEKTGFASYFLIVQDFVNWAKNQGIVVGPGRGSAAGSLASYLLSITDVNPLKYDLLFERFLNPERVSMPDIDLDFTDIRRDEVIDYLSKKYGRDNVAQIITFGTMAARAAIRDVGRALGYTYNYCDQVAKMIPFSLSLDEALGRVPELQEFYKADAQAKKLIDSAKKLEGVARHASTHACGVVITKEPLDNIVPRQYATPSGSSSNHLNIQDQPIVTQYEMHSIEDLGLLKMDLLGLKNLTIIETALKLIKKYEGLEINIDEIPLNDKKTFKLFQEAKTTGVFQFESSGMKKNLKELKPTELEDIIAMVALYRPGPMDLIPDFIARKYNKKKITYLHPKLKLILEKTYGVAVYQEQLMQIATDLAGFTPNEADTLRKAVGKKIKKLLEEQESKMIKGMASNGIDEKTAQNIWYWIEPFARYGFNRSHAACYALIGYQTAYLKANFPVEFMTSLMYCEGQSRDVDRIAVLIEEAKSMGIEVLPPDINESGEDFTIVKIEKEKGVIRFGLSDIKNVGRNVTEEIVRERIKNGPFKSVVNFMERVESKDLNKKSLESLIKAGTLDKLGERNQLFFNLEDLLKYSREVKGKKASGQESLFGGLANASVFSFKVKKTAEAGEGQKLAWEKELLGLYISRHPLENYKEKLGKGITPIKNLGLKMVGSRVIVGGIIEKIQKIITRSGQPMLFIKLKDLTDKIEVLVFPKVLERNPTIFKEDKVLLMKGVLNDRDGQIKLLCDEARELTQQKELSVKPESDELV